VSRVRVGMWLTAFVGFLVGAMATLAYTGGQADAGQQVFATICAACHGATLQGGMGPALVGSAFRANWQSAAGLLSFVARQMPLSAPGSLSPEQYTNVVAFLLRKNDIPADEKPLDAETAKETRLREKA
jgi:mono/diheme cytochrome c family protein